MSRASEVVAMAKSQLGYKEKASNKYLDDPTANPGSANYTKYARDLAAAGYYNANKNGYEWCDVFVDWCFFKCYGKDEGQRITCQTGPYGAGCTYSMKYYTQQGRFDKTPRVGDQIFFRYSGNSGADHTGIVVAVTDTTVTTVEGNSSNCVKQITYNRSYSGIVGYGHPLYSESDTAATASADEAKTASVAAEKPSTVTVTLTKLSKGSKGAEVKTVQRILRVYGINGSLAIDGSFGANTEATVIKLQKKLFPNASSEWDGVVGEKTWSAMLTELK